MGAYAVIQTGGKQYRVSRGDEVRFERLKGRVGETIAFDHVLLASDGETIEVGRPFVPDSQVVGRITYHGKGKKVTIVKHKRRKDYHRKKGHRQHFTLVRIEDIRSPRPEASAQGVTGNGT